MSAKAKIFNCKIALEYMAIATCEKDAISLAEEAIRTDSVHGGVVIAEPYHGVMADGWTPICLLYHPAITINGKKFSKEANLPLGDMLAVLDQYEAKK